MFGILVLLFTLVPAIEIYLLFTIGGEIGALNTVVVVITTGVVGASLAKSQGLSILTKIQDEMQGGGLPGKSIIHGLMVFAGGLMLMTPGFMTDILGFSLVMPGPRHILFVWVQKLVVAAMKNGNLNFQSFGTAGQTNSGSGFHSYSSHSSTGPRASETRNLNSEVEPGVFEAEYSQKKD
jgi:UPF0716 protein FxsA